MRSQNFTLKSYEKKMQKYPNSHIKDVKKCKKKKPVEMVKMHNFLGVLCKHLKILCELSKILLDSTTETFRISDYKHIFFYIVALALSKHSKIIIDS